MSTRFIAGQLVDLTSVMTDILFSNEYNDTERNVINLNVPEVFFCELRCIHMQISEESPSAEAVASRNVMEQEKCTFV